MAEPGRAPVWVMATCDGNGCRRHAVRRLALMVKALRERGFRGVLVLTEAATGRAVAARRVWP